MLQTPVALGRSPRRYTPAVVVEPVELDVELWPAANWTTVTGSSESDAAQRDGAQLEAIFLSRAHQLWRANKVRFVSHANRQQFGAAAMRAQGRLLRRRVAFVCDAHSTRHQQTHSLGATPSKLQMTSADLSRPMCSSIADSSP
jgi:hypothetical protein